MPSRVMSRLKIYRLKSQYIAQSYNLSSEYSLHSFVLFSSILNVSGNLNGTRNTTTYMIK